MAETIVDALKRLFEDEDGVLKAGDVISEIKRRYPNRWMDSSIRAHLYGCSANIPGAYRGHPSLPKFLFSLGRGMYTKYDIRKHGVWVRGYPEGEEPQEEDVVSERVAFDLEKSLEEFLSRNLEQIEPGITLCEGGRQYSTDVGYIDLLAEDKEGNLVVLELKAGTASDDALGQILRYMGWVKNELAGEKSVKGIIIAENLDDRLKSAITMVPSVRFLAYSIDFEFKDLRPGTTVETEPMKSPDEQIAEEIAAVMSAHRGGN